MSYFVKDDNQIPDIIRELESLNAADIQVGWFEGSSGSDIVRIAATHEYGAVIKSRKAIAKLWYLMKEAKLIDEKKMPLYLWMKRKTEIVIPERAPLRTASEDPSTYEALEKAFEFAVSQVFIGKMNAMQAASHIGQIIEDQVREMIVRGEGLPPANHPVTVIMKKSARTLVKSGELVRRITHEVKL